MVNMMNKKEEEKVLIANEGEKREIDYTREVLKTDSFQVYFQISNCINKYIEYINKNNEEAIKTVLMKDYKTQSYIDSVNSIENLTDFIEAKYTIKDIYSITSTYEKPYYIKRNTNQ